MSINERVLQSYELQIIVVIIGTINAFLFYLKTRNRQTDSQFFVDHFQNSTVVGCLTPVEAVAHTCVPPYTGHLETSSALFRRCSGRPAVQRLAGASCPELSCRLIRPEVPNFLCKYNRPCPLPRSCPLYEMGLLSLLAPVLVSCLLIHEPASSMAWTCTAITEKSRITSCFSPCCGRFQIPILFFHERCITYLLFTLVVIPLEVQIHHQDHGVPKKTVWPLQLMLLAGSLKLHKIL